MSDLEVTWEDPAKDLLKQRDRFTRKAIEEEFNRNPREGAINFDPEGHGFLTPVADRRYSVVWYLDPLQKSATVRAVIPTARFDDPASLKDYVRRVVATESKGLIAF